MEDRNSKKCPLDDIRFRKSGGDGQSSAVVGGEDLFAESSLGKRANLSMMLILCIPSC